MPAFQFANDKRWRKLGLEGDLLWAMTHDFALQLQDDAKHVVRIAPADIVRMRIGYVDARRRMYHARIWRNAEEKPLELRPTVQTLAGYRETVTALTQLMQDANRFDRIETGASKFDALFGPSLMAIPTVAAIVVAVFVLTNEPWWGRMIVPIVPIAVLGILVWLGRARYWPAPLRELSALKKQLP